MKVAASWYGGLMGTSMWRISSGITEAEKHYDFYEFKNYSGSLYRCHEKSYGASSLTYNKIQSLKNKIIEKKIDASIEVLSEDEFKSWIEKEYGLDTSPSAPKEIIIGEPKEVFDDF